MQTDNSGFTPAQYQTLLKLLGKTEGTAAPSEFPKADESYLAGTSFLASHLSNTHWIFDSGASDHMCNTIKLFTNIRDIASKNHKIIIPDGTTLNVMKIGDISLTKDLFLKNVLFVPEIQFNLISVSKLTLDNNISLIFSTDACYVQDHLMRRPLPLGKPHNGLYYTLGKDQHLFLEDRASLNNKHTAITASCTDKTNYVKLLHLRLGHIPFSRLKVMYPAKNL